MKILVLISMKGRLGEGNRRQFEFSLHPLNTQISLHLLYIFSPYRVETNFVSVIKTNQLMLCEEVTDFCSAKHMKHINTLFGQKVELLEL